MTLRDKRTPEHRLEQGDELIFRDEELRDFGERIVVVGGDEAAVYKNTETGHLHAIGFIGGAWRFNSNTDAFIRVKDKWILKDFVNASNPWRTLVQKTDLLQYHSIVVHGGSGEDAAERAKELLALLNGTDDNDD